MKVKQRPGLLPRFITRLLARLHCWLHGHAPERWKYRVPRRKGGAPKKADFRYYCSRCGARVVMHGR